MKIQRVRKARAEGPGYSDDDRTGSDTIGTGAGRSKGAAALIVVALILMAGLVLLVPNNLSITDGISSFLARLASHSSGSGTNTTSSFSLYSPLILNGSANITFPSDYDALSSYALGLINQDRAGSNLSPVQQSASKVSQQHADSMLRYGYFSHWDTQGFKPYMRYTLLGGRGAVAENIAYLSYFPGRFSFTAEVENAIKELEYSMMHNDSACCDNGHRDNILTPLHNMVSIGVAYNYTTVFFVEDFENNYIAMSFAVNSYSTVSMSGTTTRSGLDPGEILVTFDPTPSTETPRQLDTGPSEYDPGLLIGGVLPPCSLTCPRFTQGITVYADTWSFTATRASVSFSISSFENARGAGVYTFYLLLGSNTTTALTSISVFVNK
ncbi:MAG: CAP domain-containing protein [Thaumarchaeota archaeon]|nr:CAP domain-containing protein [Nitrososphaerota archaeon]